MEEIPKNGIISQEAHHNGLDSRRMLRLGEILDRHSLDNRNSFGKKVNISKIDIDVNRSKISPPLYEIALKTGIIVGLILGCTIGGIFLITSR